MNNLNIKSYSFKYILLLILVGFTQYSKAQNDFYTKFNSEITLNDSLFLSVYNPFNVKEDWGKLNRKNFENSCFVRVYLSNNEIVRGILMGYHKNGLFIYNSYNRTFGFYPFCKINKLKIGSSAAGPIIVSSLGIIGFSITIGVLANNLDSAVPGGFGDAAVIQAIFLPLNELYRHYAHFNWLINQDKNKAEELYNFIVSNKKLFTTTRNLTGIVD